MTETLNLPERLDLSTIGPLADALRQRMGVDLILDAGEVSHIGGLGAQILLSAAASWRATGQSLTLTGATPDFLAQTADLGLSAVDFQVAEGLNVD